MFGLSLQTVVAGGSETNSRAVLLLKVAIWVVCHVASSVAGLTHMANSGALEAVVRLASSASVYTVRGTAFMALSLVATTETGTAVLREFGECCSLNHRMKIM